MDSRDLPQAVEAGLHGAVTVGGLTLAVPISAIREVVPRPTELLPFPAERSEIIGAITLRGATVPVLDAERLLGLPSAGPSPIMLILRAGNGIIALAIQTVAGVISLAEDDLTHLTGNAGAGDRSTMMRTAFVRGALRGMVLDARALAALADMPFAVERVPVASGPGATDKGTATLLFTAGAVHLGLAASVIEASVPEQVITPSPVENGLWLGWLVYNGRRVPLVDTLRLLGLGTYGKSERAAAVIVRLSSGDQVGLRIDSVSDIRSLTSRDIMSLQDFSVGNLSLLKGLYDGGTASLVLNPEAVSGDTALIKIGQVCERTQPAIRSGRSAGDDVISLLLIRLADRHLAIPLGQVEEIIASRTSKVGLSSSEQAITDFIVHRGRGVPLIDLYSALDLPRAPETASFTVLVSADGNHAGFMVDELCAVIRAPVQRMRAKGVSAEMERVGATVSTAGRTFTVVDLRERIRSLTRVSKPEQPSALVA